MNKFYYLLNIILTLVCRDNLCKGQETFFSYEEAARNLDAKRTIDIPFRDVYAISDHIFSWYPIGVIHLDNGYTILRDKDFHYFLLTSYASDSKLKPKDILKRNDVFIIEFDLIWDAAWATFYMSFSESYQFEKLIPDNTTTSTNGIDLFLHQKGGDFTRVSCSQTPVGFLLILMTGEAYNHMTYKVYVDGGRNTLKFPDESAYYRVLVPIWEKRPTKPNNDKSNGAETQN